MVLVPIRAWLSRLHARPNRVTFHSVCSIEGAAFLQRAGGGARGEAEGLRGSCWAC